MQVRLAFAVAAHLEPEILLVDEVLAVGDAAFQRKSLAKMAEVARAGSTVVFVSHNLATIQALCERAILLEGGRVIADAPVEEAVSGYLRSLERAAATDLRERSDRDGRAWRETLVSRLAIFDEESGEADVVVGGRPARIEIDVTEVLPMMECQVTILNNLGHPVASFDSELSAPGDRRDGELGARIECRVDSLPLVPGRYRIDFLLKGRQEIQDGLQAAAFFDVEPGIVAGRPIPPAGADGDVSLSHAWHLPG
jgi:lipopolysaccharide transport system ATP-binding protein